LNYHKGCSGGEILSPSFHLSSYKIKSRAHLCFPGLYESNNNADTSKHYAHKMVLQS